MKKRNKKKKRKRNTRINRTAKYKGKKIKRN